MLIMAFATIVPMPSMTGVDDTALRRSIGFFPVAGWVLGLFLWGAMWVTAHLMPRGPAAVVVLAAYVLLTGALHLDGLADTFDAIGSRKSAHDALTVMKDSRIGTMGAVAVMLVLIGKVIAFSHLSATSLGVWVVVPVLARTSVVWSMMGTPAARPEGLGALYAQHLSKWTVAGATGVSLITATLLMPWHEALGLMLLAVASTVVWTRVIRKRFGGSTGDTYGALLEIVEWVGFLAVTGGWGYGR